MSISPLCSCSVRPAFFLWLGVDCDVVMSCSLPRYRNLAAGGGPQRLYAVRPPKPSKRSIYQEVVVKWRGAPTRRFRYAVVLLDTRKTVVTEGGGMSPKGHLITCCHCDNNSRRARRDVRNRHQSYRTCTQRRNLAVIRRCVSQRVSNHNIRSELTFRRVVTSDDGRLFSLIVY